MSRSQILMTTVALIVFACGLLIALDKCSQLIGETRSGNNATAANNTDSRYWKARYLTLELASLLQLNKDTWNAISLVRAQTIAESLQAALVEIETEEGPVNSTSTGRGSAEATLLITRLQAICHDQRTCSQTELKTMLEPTTKLIEAINLHYPEVDLSIIRSNEQSGSFAAPSFTGNLILGAILMLCGAITAAVVLLDLKRQRRPDDSQTPLKS